MSKYNNITDKFEFKTLEEATQQRESMLNNYMQVVLCPVIKYKKEVFKVYGNFQKLEAANV